MLIKVHLYCDLDLKGQATTLFFMIDYEKHQKSFSYVFQNQFHMYKKSYYVILQLPL